MCVHNLFKCDEFWIQDYAGYVFKRHSRVPLVSFFLVLFPLSIYGFLFPSSLLRISVHNDLTWHFSSSVAFLSLASQVDIEASHFISVLKSFNYLFESYFFSSTLSGIPPIQCFGLA